MTTLVERAGVPLPRPGRFAAMVVVATPALRETVAQTLRALGARQVLEVGTVAEARRRAGAGIADLAVIENVLPDGSGVGLLRELRAAGWSRGLMLATTDDPYAVRAAITAGVRAYAVSAMSGGVRPGERNEAVESLSGREVQVLQLVAEGRSNKDIGQALGLSALTVKSHLARIARKLGTGDRAEMVATAMRSGAVS